MQVGSFFLIITILFVFQPFISSFFSLFNYFDEVISLFLFVSFVYHVIKRRRIRTVSARLLRYIGLLIIIGIIGNSIAKYDRTIFAILQDMLSNCKMGFAMLGLIELTISDQQREKYINQVSSFVRILLWVMLFSLILSQFVNTGMLGEIRFGIKSFQFLYDNPATFNTYFYFLIIMFAGSCYKGNKVRKGSNKYAIIACIVWASSLRTRAIIFSVIFIILYYYIAYRAIEKIKIRWYHILGIGSIAGFLGWDTIQHYFFENGKQARFVLSRNAIELARKYFPFGAGFGTYGTEASRAFYSPIYGQLGMNYVYGLSPENSMFITDQYWFAIIGQFGVAGVLVTSLIIYNVYKIVWERTKTIKTIKLASLLFILFTALASLSAASYINASFIGTLFFLMVSSTVKPKRKFE